MAIFELGALRAIKSSPAEGGASGKAVVTEISKLNRLTAAIRALDAKKESIESFLLAAQLVLGATQSFTAPVDTLVVRGFTKILPLFKQLSFEDKLAIFELISTAITRDNFKSMVTTKSKEMDEIKIIYRALVTEMTSALDTALDATSENVSQVKEQIKATQLPAISEITKNGLLDRISKKLSDAAAKKAATEAEAVTETEKATAGGTGVDASTDAGADARTGTGTGTGADAGVEAATQTAAPEPEDPVTGPAKKTGDADGQAVKLKEKVARLEQAWHAFISALNALGGNNVLMTDVALSLCVGIVQRFETDIAALQTAVNEMQEDFAAKHDIKTFVEGINAAKKARGEATVHATAGAGPAEKVALGGSSDYFWYIVKAEGKNRLKEPVSQKCSINQDGAPTVNVTTDPDDLFDDKPVFRVRETFDSNPDNKNLQIAALAVQLIFNCPCPITLHGSNVDEVAFLHQSILAYSQVYDLGIEADNINLDGVAVEQREAVLAPSKECQDAAKNIASADKDAAENDLSSGRKTRFAAAKKDAIATNFKDIKAAHTQLMQAINDVGEDKTSSPSKKG